MRFSRVARDEPGVLPRNVLPEDRCNDPEKPGARSWSSPSRKRPPSHYCTREIVLPTAWRLIDTLTSRTLFRQRHQAPHPFNRLLCRTTNAHARTPTDNRGQIGKGIPCDPGDPSASTPVGTRTPPPLKNASSGGRGHATKNWTQPMDCLPSPSRYPTPHGTPNPVPPTPDGKPTSRDAATAPRGSRAPVSCRWADRSSPPCTS